MLLVSLTVMCDATLTYIWHERDPSANPGLRPLQRDTETQKKLYSCRQGTGPVPAPQIVTHRHVFLPSYDFKDSFRKYYDSLLIMSEEGRM